MLLQKEKTVVCLAVLSLVLMTSIVAALLFAETCPSEACPSHPLCGSCPDGWFSYNPKCYYFSDTIETWHVGNQFCSSHDASLAAVDTEQEMEFLMRAKGPGSHWIGLWREKVGQPWKWRNGSIFNTWFNIGADGPCAFLNDYAASSTYCEGKMYWICAKSPKLNF